jgi:hypothetical protein
VKPPILPHRTLLRTNSRQSIARLHHIFHSTGFSTTTTSQVSRDYPCVIYGGPRVETPYCRCTTTTNDKQFVATAPLISGQCAAYATYPSLSPTTTQGPVTQAPVAEPVTKTIDGTVLEYTSRVYDYARVYKDVTATYTQGVGDLTTLETPLPIQADANNKGSSQCHSIDDACEGAYNQFEGYTFYTNYVSRYSRESRKVSLLWLCWARQVVLCSGSVMTMVSEWKARISKMRKLSHLFL